MVQLLVPSLPPISNRMLVTYKLEFGGAVGALVFFVVLYKCCIRLMSFRSKSTKPQEEYVSYIRK